MNLTNEQIQALKAAAEKATPGRIGDRIDGSGSIKYECRGYDGSIVLKTDHKNMEYGFVGDNGDADELFFRSCVPDSILSLLAERDADKKRIAEQNEHINSLEEGVSMLLAQYDQLAAAIGWTTEKALSGEGNQEQYAEAMVKRIAELEARTVKAPYLPDDCDRTEAHFKYQSAIAAAGITLVVEG